MNIITQNKSYYVSWSTYDRTQFCAWGAVLAPNFYKTIKDYIDQTLLEIIQVTVWLHTDHLSLFGFTKPKTGPKTAPRAPKLSYFDRRAPQLSDQVTIVPSGAGVVCNTYMLNSSLEPIYNLSKNLLFLPGPRILKLMVDMVNDSTPPYIILSWYVLYV